MISFKSISKWIAGAALAGAMIVAAPHKAEAQAVSFGVSIGGPVVAAPAYPYGYYRPHYRPYPAYYGQPYGYGYARPYGYYAPRPVVVVPPPVVRYGYGNRYGYGYRNGYGYRR